MQSISFGGAGDSLPVFAIHGSASTGKQWLSLGQRLGESCQLTAPDIPGYGEQAVSASTCRAGLRGRAEPLLAMLEALQSPVDLVAHSFGAALALELLRSRPAAIRSLWLYEPVVPGLLLLGGSEGDEVLRSDLACLAEMLDRASPAVGMAAFVNFWHGGDCWSQLPESRRALLARQASVVLRDFREAFAESPPCGELLAYRGPVQIAIGEESRVHASRMAVLLGGLLPNTYFHSFKGMGHMGPCTHPKSVNDVIFKWLQSVNEPYTSRDLTTKSPALAEA